FITAEVERMLKAGIIERAPIDADPEARTYPFASPVVIVGKKDGSRRFCVDYRKLNAITETNAYPLPIIDEIFSNIAKRGTPPKYFTALDLASGYWQVPMHPDHEHKTTFTCHLGLYYFKRLPFGLKNAPASFQSMMDTIFRDQIDQHMAVYIDDINVYSASFEEHL
ncbi:3634_t:CDS:1, partial [Paraglomus occultum]